MNYYKILGISENADEKEIKEAYRNLVKKYHPDRYTGSALSDIAGEKLKEVNIAYDEIMKMRKNKTSRVYENKSSAKSGQNNQTNHTEKKYQQKSYNHSSEEVSFKAVRNLISQNKLAEAEKILTKLGQNAEWYYLAGLILLRRGMYSKAKEQIEKAVKLDPSNTEYKSVLDNFSRGTRYYKNRSSQQNKNTIGTKECLSSICPIDICFEF